MEYLTWKEQILNYVKMIENEIYLKINEETLITSCTTTECNRGGENNCYATPLLHSRGEHIT